MAPTSLSGMMPAQRHPSGLQFDTRFLMVLIVLSAFAFTLIRHAGLLATVYVTILLAVSLCGWPKATAKRGSFIACLAVSQAVLLVGLACAVSAYYTVGEVGSVIYWLFMVLHVGPVALCATGRFRWGIFAAVLVAGAVAVTLVPEQVVLGHRLSRLRRETSSIVTFAVEHQLQSGRFPSDLSGYTFRHSDLRDHIRYESGSGGFRVDFWVEQPGISHWYSARTGWGYYPD